MKKTISTKLVALWFCLAAISPALAVQNNWTGAGGDMLWTNSANWSLGVPPDSTQDVLIDNTGTNAVVLDASAQAGSLMIGSNGELNLTGGTLYSVGTWTGPGKLRWLSGTLENFNFGTNLLVEMSGADDKIAHGYCTNRGTIRWQSEARLLLNSSSFGNASLLNAGQFILETNCTMINDSWVYQTTGFINAGTLQVPAGRGVVTLDGFDVGWLGNRGTLLVETNSTLTFIHRGEGAGFLTGTVIEGAGLVRIAGAGGGLFCDGNITLNGTLEAAGRRIYGASTWNGTGLFRWLSGKVGTVTFGTNLNVELNGPEEKLVDGPCVNLGSCTLQTNCTLSPATGTTSFINRGTLRVPANLGEVTLFTTACVFQNEGVLQVETNSVLIFHPSYQYEPQFLSGTIFEGAGLIRLTEYNFTCSGALTLNSTVEVAGGYLGSYEGSSWSGPGLFRWLSGGISGVTFGPGFQVEASSPGDKVIYGPSTNLGTVRLMSASFGCEAAFNNLGLFILETNCSFAGVNGVEGFNNAGTLLVPANKGELVLSMPGAAMRNTGTVRVETNSTLVIDRGYYERFHLDPGTIFDGPGMVRLVFCGVANSQTVTVNSTVEITGDSAMWESSWNGPGLLRLQYASLRDCIFGSDLHIEMTGSDQKVIDGTCTNFGTFRWLQASPVIAGSGAATFLNNGLFSTEADGAWTNNIAFSNLPGGTFRQATGQFSLTSLNNSGGLELLGGRLNVVSNFVAAPGSSCKVALRGYSPGTDFGQLQAGDLTLNGSLIVNLANGFAPTNGSTFLIATNAVRHGQFASAALPPLTPELSWQTSYQPTAVTLQVISPPTLGEAAMLPDGSFQFTLTGSTGGTFEIQASTNLVDWLTLTNAPFAGSAVFTDSTASNFTHRFYRGVLLGP